MRDLSIVIDVQTAQATEALARVERGLEGVAQAAVPADKNLDLIAQHAPDVRAKLDEMKASLNRTEEALKKKTEAVKTASPVLATLTGIVRQYAAPAALGFAIKQTMDFADRVTNLAAQLGVTPKFLQGMAFSAKQFGLTLDPIVHAIGTMSDRIGSGDKSAVSALEKLGFTLDGMRDRNPEEAFIDIAKAAAGIKDPMELAALWTDIFGKGSQKILPLVKADFEQLMKRAEDLGLVLNDKTLKSASDLDDKFGELLDVGKRLLSAFFEPLLPILNAIVPPITFVTAELGKMISFVMDPGGHMARFVAELRSVAQYLGIIAGAGPGALPFIGGIGKSLPAGPSIPGYDFSYGVQGDGVPRASVRGRGGGGGGGRSNVLPFAGYEPMDAEYLAWLQQARGPMSMRVPGVGPGTFPGWAQQPLSNTMNLPWAQYPGTVPMNRPGGGGGGGFMSGWGGRMLGTGVGMATQFLPGMNQQGSMIGSGIGSALGSLQGVMKALGSFAPMLGPLAGIAGGLLGKLFGGGEAGQVKKDRSGFIDKFGGMAELQKAADTAGFSLDKLLNTKKAAEFTAEVKKLEEAMGAFDRKVQEATAELDDLQSELSGVMGKAEAMGYNFDASGELVSVSFKKMQETAEKYGVSVDALGPAFQRQRLHEGATQIINDFTLLSKGGADTGTILLGMSDAINKLVNDSIKFGVDIPANMQPWIENLINANKLTDENGVAITDLTRIKFGQPVATEFDKIQGSLKELIDKIGALVDRIAAMGSAVDTATRPRTIQIGYDVESHPDVPGMSLGGFVGAPRYLASGGFISRGTDSVPAMLTPGEGVLRRDAVSRLMRGDWPSGGQSMMVSIDSIQIGSHATEAEAEVQLGRALVRGLKRKGVRLNAA